MSEDDIQRMADNIRDMVVRALRGGGTVTLDADYTEIGDCETGAITREVTHHSVTVREPVSP